MRSGKGGRKHKGLPLPFGFFIIVDPFKEFTELLEMASLYHAVSLIHNQVTGKKLLSIALKETVNIT